MNTSRKGYTKEALCKKKLEREGWKIVFQSIRTRWATYDLADLFDIVAVKEVRWKFVSVKNYANFQNLPKHQNEIRDFKEKYGLEDMDFELWCWSKARYVGRGKDKHWQEAKWVIKEIK